MKTFFSILLVLILTMSVVPVSAQSDIYRELHRSGLDTLTGVVTDSALINIKVGKLFNGQLVMPKTMGIFIEYTADISSGEGIDLRVQQGTIDIFEQAALVNQFAAAAVGDVAITLVDLTAAAGIGTRFKISVKQEATGADTDSLSTKWRVFGIYPVQTR